ncbi:recombinase family protein, partial [Mesorhizobium sp. M8A.F.Ca.ET.059.01.1.1]
MSTDTQTYSIHNQRDAIGEYADIMGYDIVATYEDPGRSGLNIEGRPGLQRLLMDVESGQADFETVVVYDVSRWGRFQNIDESASYEYRCQRAGVRIEFCAEQFANDGTIGSDVLKAIKRSMAAELSRMLSIKVFLGQRRVVKMGFCGGGLAGYGLRRLLVDEAGEPKFILKRRQYKGLASDRVVLVPGPPEEIAVVRWIFSQFVKGKSRIEIVRALNKRGVLTEMGRTWTSNTVHTVLNNERYIGNIVWNRKSEKLHGKRARNPASAWVRAEKSCEPILDRKVFLRARAVADARAPLSNERMLADLSKLLVERGKLSEHIINAAPGCVSVSTYQ